MKLSDYFAPLYLSSVIASTLIFTPFVFSAETSAQAGTDTVVILESYELGRYNPVLGHGRSGESHILVRCLTDSSREQQWQGHWQRSLTL